jgi:hypothetical protein
MKRWVLTAALICLPVSAQAMTVAEFLAKADALKAKGMFALMSSDIGLLKAEMKSVGSAYRDDILAARKAGTPPHSCPPPRGTKGASMTSTELLDELRKVPPAQARTTSMKTAFYAMMKRRFPCPA